MREYPDPVRKYFGKVVPPDDNKFAALNTAAWSGGSFVYVPKGVHVDIPLQAYFRINTPNMGQFERTLIIADEGSYVHYVEGCTAPIYSTDSLHAAIVEIIVEKHARVRYTTVQNWSNNVYNLVTQRAYVREGGTMEWVDGNIGPKATMKYPACILARVPFDGGDPVVRLKNRARRCLGPRYPRDANMGRIQRGAVYVRHTDPCPSAGGEDVEELAQAVDRGKTPIVLRDRRNGVVLHAERSNGLVRTRRHGGRKHIRILRVRNRN